MPHKILISLAFIPLLVHVTISDMTLHAWLTQELIT